MMNEARSLEITGLVTAEYNTNIIRDVTVSKCKTKVTLEHDNDANAKKIHAASIVNQMK